MKYNRVLIIGLLLSLSPNAQAYFGMGPILPMLGNAFVVLFAFGAAFIGLVAYPLKLAWDNWKGKKAAKKKAKTSKK